MTPRELESIRDWLPSLNAIHYVDTDDCLAYMKEMLKHIDQQKQRIRELEAALAWYGEQARLARLIHREGDTGRYELAKDGGKRAKELLEPPR